MKKLLLVALCFSLLVSCKKKEATEEMPATSAIVGTKVQPVEFSDAKYSNIGKKSLESLSKGDMDTWMSAFADNAKFYWNNGDSLVGKPAIDKYWRNRRGNVIETITFEKPIWLPIKVNDLENVSTKGFYLLSWYKTTAKYKGGKSMTQRVHTIYHFDDKDKIDEVNQYIDKAPINEALKK